MEREGGREGGREGEGEGERERKRGERDVSPKDIVLKVLTLLMCQDTHTHTH